MTTKMVMMRGDITLKNVHGHIHQRKLEDSRYHNVSVERINYTPVHIEDLRIL